MKYLSESVISRMPLKRLKALRTRVLAHINSREKTGKWCCELKCMWVEDAYREYPQYEKNADYAYRDMINKYYDIANVQCQKLIDKYKGREWTKLNGLKA